MGLTGRQIAMLAVLISGTFITILNQTLVTPALPSIMNDTGVDASTVQWLTTGFTMVNAVMIPVTAFLTDRFPTRTLFVGALSIFCVGTILCGFGPNFPVLLIGRLVQAAGAGVLMPMVMTVLLLTFPVEKRGFAMGLFGITIMLAPALGPTVSGLIIDNSDWHFMFYAVAVLVFIDILLGVFVLDRSPKEVPEGLSLDKPSVVMSTIGFGCMLYGFSVIGNSGISIPAVASTLVGVVVTVLFFRRQLKMEVPMLQVRVLQTRKFLVATILGMIVQGGIMANGVLIPIYVQQLCGQSATVSGLVLLPGSLLMGIMSPIAGKLFDNHGPRAMSIVGTVVLTLTTLAMCFLSTTTSMIFLCVCIALRNFSMSLVNMPVNTWGMNALSNRYMNHGNAVNNTLRQAAGSLGTALVISAYSIMSGICASSMDWTAARITGMNFAFVVQVVIFGAAAIIAIFCVKEKPEDAKQKLGEDVSSSDNVIAAEGADAADAGASEALESNSSSMAGAEREDGGTDKQPSANKQHSLSSSATSQNTATQPASIDPSTPMRAIMKTDFPTIPEDATIADAVELLAGRKSLSALIVASDGSLRGIINDGDIVRAIEPHSNTIIDPVSLLVSASKDNHELRERLKDVLASKALDHATTNVVTVDVNADVETMLNIMGTHHIRKAPVLEDGKVVGVVHRDEFTVRVLTHYLDK